MNQGMRRGPFTDTDNNHDAVRKAKELRNKSKIPRIRTMKKILKQIKARNKTKSTGNTI